MSDIPEDRDLGEALREAVQDAAAAGGALRIVGGDSKAFYGRHAVAPALAVGGHRGVIGYEPTELVLRARTGTPLADIEALLAQHDQMLACDPPHFAPGATLGGAVACGLSGPARPWRGALRDAVLGVQLIDGRGQLLRFGGQVMKNVAGYDLSRLMCGALGILGVLLEVSLRVAPRPARQRTLVQEASAAQFLERMAAWGRRPLPLDAACHLDGRLWLRLAGSGAGVDAAAAWLGGDSVAEAEAAAHWQGLREQRLTWFDDQRPLWRLSVPPAARLAELPADTLLDWGGAQRWLLTEAPAEALRAAATAVGGHATLFRGGDRQTEVFQPLDPVTQRLHAELKRAFDPQGVFNPGRMYAAL